MLESMLIILVVVAILLLILSFYWESLSIASVDFVLWLTLSAGVYNIDIPYQGIDSTDVVVTGVQTINDLWMLSWLFMGLAVIMLVYIFYLSFELLKGRQNKIM